MCHTKKIRINPFASFVVPQTPSSTMLYVSVCVCVDVRVCVCCYGTCSEKNTTQHNKPCHTPTNTPLCGPAKYLEQQQKKSKHLKYTISFHDNTSSLSPLVQLDLHDLVPTFHRVSKRQAPPAGAASSPPPLPRYRP